MANFITSGIENLLGLETNAGTAELQQAIQALASVNVPNIAQLTLPELQRYVSAGVLSPQQYQAIAADPNTFQNIANSADQTGYNAQKAALQQLGGIAQTGSTPIMQAQLANNLAQTNQAMQAARAGISENAQERGVAGGGQEFLNKLLNEQSNAQNANLGAINAGANNAQLALQALANQANLGGQMQSQESAEALAKAQAAQQIAEYNSQLQSMANQYNTQNANAAQAANLANAQGISNQNTGLSNYRTQYNAQLPQQVYQDQLQKAQGMAGAFGNMANLKQNQAAQQNAFTGNLIGAGANLYGDYLMGNAMNRAGNTSAPQIPGGATNPTVYPGQQRNAMLNEPWDQRNMAMGGEVKDCYAIGGEVHDHEICMKAGGQVPGEANVPGDSPKNDTVPAKLSPHEIVLPRTVAQAPNAPQAAAQFVGNIKGQQMGSGKPFAEVIKELEADGLELRLCPKGY